MSATNLLKRRAGGPAGWPRPLALALAAATGASLLAAGGPAGLTAPAQATQYLAGWNGVFTRQQLYAIGGGQLNSVYAWDQPTAATTLPTAQRIFDKSTGSNGASSGHTWETFGVGPLYAAAGDYTLHGVGWASGATSPITVMERNNSSRQLNAVTMTPFAGTAGGRTCTGGSALSGAVNQQDGTIYAIMSSASQAFPANANPASGVRLSIYRVVKASTGVRYASCLATSGGSLTPRGQTIYEAWSARFGGTPPFAQSANWALASDVAIDAKGDAYVLARNATNRHALLRFNLPRDGSGALNPNGQFTYEVVQFFTAAASTAGDYGLAFLDGKLYAQDAQAGRMWRYDPVAGTVANLGAGGPNPPKDLASAQMAPMIEGTVFNDANGNSQRDSGEGGVAGAVIVMWQKNTGQSGWTAVTSMSTDAQGHYSTLAPSANGEFLLRLREPRINGVNATQTYASAGRYSFRSGTPNIVLAYCFNQVGDYQAISQSGACYGARADGIDPPVTSNPVDPAGGANIVSHVVMRTDLAVATADFGVTAAGSWGDAPSIYHSSNLEQGPYANPRIGSDDYLYLGARAGFYSDGQPSPAANAHPTDDGLEIARKVLGQADADLPWQPAQDQLMVVGETYRVRAEASGLAAAVASSHVKAWITSLSGAGVAANSMDRTLLGGGGCSDSPDADGYVYCDYQPGSTPPAGGLRPVFARLRVGATGNFTATSRGPSNLVNDPWMPKGEIEDYRLGVAEAVLRIEARNLGGVAANADLSFSNISATEPSFATDSVPMADSGDLTASPTGHAIVARDATTKITTEGVGKAGASQLNGWVLGAAACRDTATGADLAALDDAVRAVTIPVPSSGELPRDITCQLTYRPEADPSASTVTAEPSGNSAPTDRLVIPDATAQVKLNVASQVQDAAGDSQNRPAPGAEVELKLAAGPGAPAGGATLQYSDDAGATWQEASQSHTCRTAEDGNCADLVRVKASDRGVYHLSAAIGGAALKNAASGQPSDTSPVEIWFREGPPAAGQISLTDSADKLANYSVAGPGQGDSYQLAIKVTDASGNGVTGLGDADFIKTCALGPAGQPGTSCPADVGVVFGPVTAQAARGDGHYTMAVYSTKAGAMNIGLWVSGLGEALPKAGDPKQRHVTATFKAMASIDPAKSSFTVAKAGAKFASPTNNPAARYFHSGLVELRDANGNPINGAVAQGKLVWAESDPPASRVEITADSAAAGAGRYNVKIWSGQAASYAGLRVRFTQDDGSYAYLTEADTVQFVPDDPVEADSSMTITK
ncbi:MAG: hypothetical protein LBD90_00710, partial [Bifidobacteriaceae bacterium]|nr:hypothetical protein [Bifidobacteriaceae bacterium]